MPVHRALRDGILVVTVDGDHTTAELRRVSEAGARDPATPKPLCILLDVTGAASLAGPNAPQLQETADFFAGLGEALRAVAIVAPAEVVAELMGPGHASAAATGPPPDATAGAFRRKEEALAWLGTRR